jgi:S1-C subfamily serine protease
VIDVILVLMLVGAGVLGWRRGLGVSLVAGAAFAVAGTLAAAIAVAIGRPAPVAAFLLGGLVGLVPVALRLQQVTDAVESVLGDRAAARTVDRVLGAALNVFVAACIGWFVAAVATIAPGDSPALDAMRSSAVFGKLVAVVPPQGTLGTVVLRSGLVPALNGPLVLAEDPDPRAAYTPAVLQARASVLQVRSTACNRLVTGTGWVAGPGLVVTNAHVVAGSQSSYLAGGPQYAGARSTVTAFDPVNDIAVLVVDDPAQASSLPATLPITLQFRHGQDAAVIGFPLGGQQTVQPARVDRVASFSVEPLGGGTPVDAQVLAFRATVKPGNSGGPLVSTDGHVIGLVVAKALGQRRPAAYGAPAQLLERVLVDGSRRQRVSTGRCLSEEDLTS